ncbi:hypothetical protein IWW50_005137 [Coemansia erecta]|nr:hypothetical protein IWW50_005137 [Coemansia erecta]
MAARPWLSASGAVIEPLLMIMPNLRYMFVESRHFNEPWCNFKSTFISYSIATRFDTQAGTRWLSLLDFVAGYSANIVDGLQSKVIMTREEEDEPTDGRVQGSSADDCEPGPPFDNCIRFCAEYIRRLHILDLPRSALGPSSSIGDLLDSTPCDIEENYLRCPWFGIRYRSMFHIPNIWYGLTRGGITRYEMFAFNRDTDSGALTADNINGRGKKPFAPTAGE